MKAVVKPLCIALSLILIVFASWWAWGQMAPKPLGDRLEYLGKEDFGGWFIRDSSDYFYGTDMAPAEIVGYFNKLELKYPPEDSGRHTEIWYKGQVFG